MNSTPDKRKRHTILLIDSDAGEYYQSLVATVRNCRVIAEKNKQKACDFFFRNDIDLVLLNHTSDNHCTELLQVFRFISPSVPVIIVTAYGSEELAVTVFKNGASDYIKKPLNIDELKHSIEAALDKTGRRDFNPSVDGIHKAIQHINANYCLPIRLSHIAREAGMSVSCLGRTFKKTLSVTFSMYLNKARIARAIQILEGGPKFSINEIAFACGYTNQYHFSRMFKKMTKTCPRDFKRALTINRLQI